MASNLVIETGIGMPDASSYVSAAVIRAYALARGVVLAPDTPEGDALVDQMAIKAMDYIEALRNRFYGYKATLIQRLSFPREGIPADVVGYYRDPTVIPAELVEAQCRLAMAVKKGVDLLPTQVSGKFVKRQKLGPLEREFSEAVGIFQLPQMPDIDALVETLLKPSNITRSYRV